MVEAQIARGGGRVRASPEGGRRRWRRGRSRPLVLIAEDDPNDRDIYGKTLWYNGFDVVYAEDGEAAVSLAREHRPDIVLVDLQLPKLHGIEACRRIKAHPETAVIPVLALTARAEREFGVDAREAGCAGYLEKPIGPVDVLKAVERVVGRPPPAGED